jgi:hypothetical protein
MSNSSLIGGLALNAWGSFEGLRMSMSLWPQTRTVSDASRTLPDERSTAMSYRRIAPQQLDGVHGLDGVLAYDESKSRATEADLLGVKVAVRSLEDLRAMKRAAGRTRDKADLEDLDAAGH